MIFQVIIKFDTFMLNQMQKSFRILLEVTKMLQTLSKITQRVSVISEKNLNAIERLLNTSKVCLKIFDRPDPISKWVNNLEDFCSRTPLIQPPNGPAKSGRINGVV